MFGFGRRRWAIRVVEKTSTPVTSRAGTAMIELLIFASKQTPLPVAESVLIPAARIGHNQYAVVRLAEELAVHPAAAEKPLMELRGAARQVAAEHGYAKVVEVIDREAKSK
jgi:hypothetical protein